MAIDHDTCFTMRFVKVPFLNSFQNYHSQYFAGAIELNPLSLSSLYTFTTQYMDENNLVPKYTGLWTRIQNTATAVQSLPVFQDSFEIVRKSFMLRDDVKAFHHALTDSPPYGYFTHGWTADNERFLTAAIFGTKSNVITKVVPGFIQKDLDRGIKHDQACRIPFETTS